MLTHSATRLWKILHIGTRGRTDYHVHDSYSTMVGGSLTMFRMSASSSNILSSGDGREDIVSGLEQSARKDKGQPLRRTISDPPFQSLMGDSGGLSIR